MGGVNLAEETQRILGSTQFVGTQIRSIKDEIFLHSIPLQNKIRQIGMVYSFSPSLKPTGNILVPYSIIVMIMTIVIIVMY